MLQCAPPYQCTSSFVPNGPWRVPSVRDQIGPVAALRRVDVIAGLPKTRSGKILRKTMRGIADGRDEPVPSTIEDAAVLDALRPVLAETD